MAKVTRGKKFAANKGSKYMAEIGSRGGKNSPSNFQKIPGLARRAGKRGGVKRQINRLQAKVDDNTITDSERTKLVGLEAQYEGTMAIDMDKGVAQKFEDI